MYVTFPQLTFEHLQSGVNPTSCGEATHTEHVSHFAHGQFGAKPKLKDLTQLIRQRLERFIERGVFAFGLFIDYIKSSATVSSRRSRLASTQTFLAIRMR